ncbi:MAG: hypothetical protein VKL39_16900 [Leptolyngbyaceae bacterium]|nr:hypothetical protein [Leptolyngbyaceae bacterium]
MNGFCSKSFQQLMGMGICVAIASISLMSNQAMAKEGKTTRQIKTDGESMDWIMSASHQVTYLTKTVDDRGSGR